MKALLFDIWRILTGFKRTPDIVRNDYVINNINTWLMVRKAFHDELVSHLPDNVESVLEVGAGDLAALNAVAEKYGRDVLYHAVELSERRLIRGLNIMKYHGFTVRGQAFDVTKGIPLPDKSVDLAYTCHCLEQLPRDFKFVISEMERVAKNVILFEPCYELANLRQKIYMRANDYVRGIEGFNTKKFKRQINPLNPTAVYWRNK